jgi:uncharacterized protein YwbE
MGILIATAGDVMTVLLKSFFFPHVGIKAIYSTGTIFRSDL